MKIQPKKNTNLPKYAAAIMAAMSAGLMSGYAAPNTAAQPAAQPMASAQENDMQVMPEGEANPNSWEDVELAGVMPVPTDDTEEPTELAGTTPVIQDTTASTDELELGGDVAIEPEPTEELYLAGEPVIESDTTEELHLEGTTPIIQDTTMPTTEPEPTLEGTTPIVIDTTEPPEPEHELVDVIRLQKFLLGKERVAKSMRTLLDLNGDGEIDVFDLALMKREVLEGKK